MKSATYRVDVLVTFYDTETLSQETFGRSKSDSVLVSSLEGKEIFHHYKKGEIEITVEHQLKTMGTLYLIALSAFFKKHDLASLGLVWDCDFAGLTKTHQLGRVTGYNFRKKRIVDIEVFFSSETFVALDKNEPDFNILSVFKEVYYEMLGNSKPTLELSFYCPFSAEWITVSKKTDERRNPSTMYLQHVDDGGFLLGREKSHDLLNVLKDLIQFEEIQNLFAQIDNWTRNNPYAEYSGDDFIGISLRNLSDDDSDLGLSIQRQLPSRYWDARERLLNKPSNEPSK